MFKLAAKNYPLVRELFPKSFPNLAFIYAVIEHFIPGEIWINRKINPTACLITTGAQFCFLSGILNEQEIVQLKNILASKKTVKLVIDPINPLDLSCFGFIPLPRHQYKYHNTNAAIPFHENNSRYLLKKIDDAETFQLCDWSGLLLDFFGSVDNYLKNGLGFVLIDKINNTVVSEAHGVKSKIYVEVGTATHENYRGQNLSTIVCNHLIRYVIRQNLQPVWSCDQTNIISQKVAKKQGMDDFTSYMAYTVDLKIF